MSAMQSIQDTQALLQAFADVLRDCRADPEVQALLLDYGYSDVILRLSERQARLAMAQLDEVTQMRLANFVQVARVALHGRTDGCAVSVSGLDRLMVWWVAGDA